MALVPHACICRFIIICMMYQSHFDSRVYRKDKTHQRALRVFHLQLLVLLHGSGAKSRTIDS